MSENRRDLTTPPGLARTSAGTKSVLVVDDEAAFGRALERVLRAAGFAVTVVHDGAAAVEAIVQQPFDVILSDITMQKMTGVELLRFVRAHDPDLPVILMTGTLAAETAVEAVGLGAFEYLEKPMSNAAIVDAVARASRQHRPVK